MEPSSRNSRSNRRGCRPEGPDDLDRSARANRDPLRHPAGALPERARPDHRRNRYADDRDRPLGQCPVHVGRHDLSAHEHDHRADLRQAVRPVRTAHAADVRRHAVPDWLVPVRAGPGHEPAHPLPRHPGPRRGRHLPHRAGRHRRPVHTPGARQVPGPVRRRVRHLGPDRARARRLPDRPGQLALGLLRQPADRRRRPGDHVPTAAPPPADRCDTDDRLPRRGRLHRGDDPDPDRHHQLAVPRLRRSVGRRADPGRPGPHRCVRLGRVARQGTDHAARPVPQPDLLGVDPGRVPGQLRLLRCDHLPAALVPGRQRLDRDRVGLPAAAAARRPDPRVRS